MSDYIRENLPVGTLVRHYIANRYVGYVIPSDRKINVFWFSNNKIERGYETKELDIISEVRRHES